MALPWAAPSTKRKESALKPLLSLLHRSLPTAYYAVPPRPGQEENVTEAAFFRPEARKKGVKGEKGVKGAAGGRFRLRIADLGFKIGGNLRNLRMMLSLRGLRALRGSKEANLCPFKDLYLRVLWVSVVRPLFRVVRVFRG